MIDMLREWYQRHFSDPQVVSLALLLIFGIVVLLLLGHELAPVIAGVVIAYVLEGAVNKLSVFKFPRLFSVCFVVTVFIALVLITLLILIPKVTKQLVQFFRELPSMLEEGNRWLMTLPERYPLIPEDQINDIISNVNAEVAALGQKVVSISLASVIDIFTLMVYLVVVPLLVFFLLKDKTKILNWLSRFLPKQYGLASVVWLDVDTKIGNYIRGKLMEVLIVGVATFIPLAYMGLHYAALLSLFVGLSVIIPYVGAVAVTIPVTLIAWFQFGPAPDFLYLMGAYLVVQFLDANILVPLLYSEVVNMNPAAIIIAVLVFGALWGVWGVFFAIPLATLIQAVINAWPSMQVDQQEVVDNKS